MGLTVITGGPNAGTTGVLYETVRGAVRDGRSAQLLLPTMPDVRRAQHALATDCPIGLGIGQLDRLIETEWALRGDGRRPVNRVERRALLSTAWRRVAPERSLGEGLLRLLSVLARRSAEEGPRGEPLPPKGAAGPLVQAVITYRALLAQEGLVEPGEAARLLARGTAVPAELVVVHRFVDIGPAQCSVLLAWARSAEVLVSLPFDPAVPATAVTEGLIAHLEAAGAHVRACADQPARGAELDAVSRRLFAAGNAVTPAGAISLAVAQGPEAEARLAVAHVERALADDVAPERIVVAFRDPARHYPWLRRVLEEHGLVADYDVSLPAGETPLGRAILRAWAFATGGQKRSDLGAFLRSPYAGTPADAVDAADARWRAARTPDGPRLLEALPRGDPGRALVSGMMNLAGLSLDGRGARMWQVWADTLLANGYPGDAPKPGGHALIDTAVHRALLDAVDALARIEGATAAQAVAALRETLVSQSSVEQPGHVQVMAVERLRSRRFDVVVLGGLTSSEFPRRGAGDTFEGDAVQEAMRALGVTYDQAEETARERLLFALSVTRARRSLTLLRQESDEEGRALRRSVFWDELLDVYRDPADPEDQRGPVPERLLAERIAGAETRAARACTPRGVLADSQVLEQLATGLDTVGASDIEAYLACPYAWFVERVLRPWRPDVGIDPRVRGVVAHDALARVYRALPEATGKRRVTPETLPRALEVASGAIAEALATAPEAHTLEERRALGSVRSSVLGLVGRDAIFLPLYEPAELEWVFGRDDEAIDLGGFRLKGRVDRIDTGPEGLVVIDYKSSSATPAGRFLKEGKIQLQLYAIAASRRLGLPVAGALYRSLATLRDRGFLLPDVTAPGIVSTDRRSAEEIDELLGQAVETARTAVDAMRAGDIPSRPDDRRCSRCVAAGFCEGPVR